MRSGGIGEIEENLRFLVREVAKQLDKTERVLEQRDGARRASTAEADRFEARDDYIDTLKKVIQRKCFALAAQAQDKNKQFLETLRGFDVIAANLERIADFCADAVEQASYVQEQSLLRDYDFGELIGEVQAGLARIEEAVQEQDVQTALQICRAEFNTDQLYQESFHQLLGHLADGGHPQSLVTIIFIVRYMERMGDALLNIGEAIISMALGERLKIDQFLALQDTLEAADMTSRRGAAIEDIFSLEGVGETRSGCTIDRVRRRGGGDEATRSVIFKEGRVKKLLEEKRALSRWQEIQPGLVPKVISFHYAGDSASMLVEFLDGQTFDQLVFSPDLDLLNACLARLFTQLEESWAQTRQAEPAAAKHIGQLQKRLPDVLGVHPHFQTGRQAIADLEVTGLTEIVETLLPLDDLLVAPYSVFIHGDFNVDNIMFDTKDHRIHFIDVHRSGYSDYVQDVSVFLVSNLRLQVLETEVKRRIQHVVRRFYEFIKAYAVRQGDTLFAARLTAGIARSLATSTRFVLDEEVADSMMLRARYLLERLAKHPRDDLASLEFPEEVLYE